MRPISLINVLTCIRVKTGFKAIAKSLKAVLHSVIHHNHCAYVKDRTICDAVRSIEDILNYTKRYQAEGRSISIYFKKACYAYNRATQTHNSNCGSYMLLTRITGLHRLNFSSELVQYTKRH